MDIGKLIDEQWDKLANKTIGGTQSMSLAHFITAVKDITSQLYQVGTPETEPAEVRDEAWATKHATALLQEFIRVREEFPDIELSIEVETDTIDALMGSPDAYMHSVSGMGMHVTHSSIDYEGALERDDLPASMQNCGEEHLVRRVAPMLCGNWVTYDADE